MNIYNAKYEDLKKFKFEYIHHSPIITIFGGNEIDRHLLVKDIYKNKLHCQRKIIFSLNKKYQELADGEHDMVYEIINDDILTKIYERQNNMNPHHFKTLNNGIITPFNPYLSIIIDYDLVDNLKNFNIFLSDNIAKIMVNGRFHKMSMTLVSKNPLNFSPGLIANIDNIFYLGYSDTQYLTNKDLLQKWSLFYYFGGLREINTEIFKKRQALMLKISHGYFPGYEDLYIYQNAISRAVNIIENAYLNLLARRNMTRLKIQKELIFYPGVGIEYQKAMDNFQSLNNP